MQEIATVAMRRVKLSDTSGENLFNLLREKGYTILPNTSGCFTAKDAVLTAQLAREALETSLIKLEVIGDDQTLFPMLSSCYPQPQRWSKMGSPCCPTATMIRLPVRSWEDIGCATVMPLGAPIGSGMGIRNPYNIQIIRDIVSVPVIVDAGSEPLPMQRLRWARLATVLSAPQSPKRVSPY